MTMNMPPEPLALATRLRESSAALLAATDPYMLLRYQDFGGTPADRAAVTGWLRRLVPKATGDTLLICPGMHSALVACCRNWLGPGKHFA